MAAPTRYPSGVVNRGSTHPMGMLPMLDPTRHFVFFEDFKGFTISAAGLSGWHADNIGTTPTIGVADAGNGILTLLNAGSAGDHTHYQWASSATAVHELFLLAAGKKAWLRTRFKIEDADQSLLFSGLQNATDDPWNAEATDQFNFRTLSADPDALQFAAGATATTEVTIALGNLEDDTWVTCTAYYDGKNTVHAWRENDAGVITNQGSAIVTATTAGDLLPNTEMTVHFGHEAVDAGTDLYSIDYIFAAVER